MERNMPVNNQPTYDKPSEPGLREVQRQLEEMFSKMEYDVELLLFTAPGQNDFFCDTARQIIRVIRQVAPRISLREYDVHHELGECYGVNFSPTLLLDPELYRIQWLGAPLGEEIRAFIQALQMLGNHQSRLSEESLRILERIDSKREITAFVSPTCPYCPQQVVNGLMAAIARPELISLKIVDIQANPVLADQYQAHSVPQVYANETLIALGAQPEELFMASVAKLEQQTVFIPESDAEEVEADLVIVGSGPAGLTAGIYAARSGLKSVVIEKGALGGQVATTPVVENYPGFTQIGGKTLVDIMVTHALEYVNIFPGEEVMRITPGELLIVETNRRRFKARAVLLATGAAHRRLGVDGETGFAGRGISYCSTCDGPLFKGKKAIVVGGGNSALTDVLHLHNIGVDVTLVHRRDSFRAQQHLVDNLKAANIPVLFNNEVRAIRGREKVEKVELSNNQTGVTTELAVDAVFIAVGYDPAVGLARAAGVELTKEGFIKQDAQHRTNIPGIYSAGDVGGGYKQIVTAAGQGSEAALVIFEDLINPYWKKQQQPERQQ
jgi:thioredoxin reductase (NADPH)